MIPFLSLFIDYSPFLFEMSISILLLATFLRIFYFPYNKNELKKLLSRFKKRFIKPTLYPDSDSFQHEKIKGSENSHLNENEPFIKLENRSMKRKEWLENQSESYLTYMDQLKFTRSQIKSRLRKFQKYEYFATPFQINKNRYFYFKKLQKDLKHNVLYTTLNVRHKGNVLLDPNIEFRYFSATLIGTWISFDAEKLCYAYTDHSNNDQIIIRIRDINDGKDSMIDNISFPSEGSTIFSLCWIHKKHPGFFYTRLDTDSSHQQIVCFHQIGTTQNNDIIIYTCQGDAYNDMLPSLAPIITVSYNDDYLIVELFVESDSFSRSAYSGKGNKLVIIDVSHFDGQDKNSLGDVYVIVDSVSNRWEYINNDGEEFLFRTNYLSEGFRMVKYLLGDRFLNDLVEYIPMDSKKMVMEEAYMAAQTVLVLKCFNSLNGAHVVLLYDLCESGGILRGPLESVASLPHPPFGVIGALNCSYFSNDIFYGFSSFSEPSSIYRAVVRRHAEDQDIELSFDQVYSSGTKSIDSSLYSTRRIEFTGEDGRQIPMYIFGLKSSFESKKKPCILHVRKSFGYPLCPQFSLSVILFVKHYNGFFCTVDLYSKGGYKKGSDPKECTDQWGSVRDLRRAADYLTGMNTNAMGHMNVDTNEDDDITNESNNENGNSGTQNHENELKSVNCTTFCAPGQLALHTGTNGSITAALCIIKYPHLFNAVAIDEGVFDLMRYHLIDPTPPLPSTSTASPYYNDNDRDSPFRDEVKTNFMDGMSHTTVDPSPSSQAHSVSAPFILPSVLPPVSLPLARSNLSLSINNNNPHSSDINNPHSSNNNNSHSPDNKSHSTSSQSPSSHNTPPLDTTNSIISRETHEIDNDLNSNTKNLINNQPDNVDDDGDYLPPCPSNIPPAPAPTSTYPSLPLPFSTSNSELSLSSSLLSHSHPPLSSQSSCNDFTWSTINGIESTGGSAKYSRNEDSIEMNRKDEGGGAIGDNEECSGKNGDGKDELYESCKQEMIMKKDTIVDECEIGIYNKEIKIDKKIGVIQSTFRNDDKLDLGGWKRHALYEELGCSEESENEHKRLLTVSPLHIISEENSRINNKKNDDVYKPAILLITRENSIRSVHSYKFIAALQDNVKCNSKKNNPVVLMNIRNSINNTIKNENINKKSPNNEHNEKNENVKIENTAMSDIFSFLASNIHAEWSGSQG